MPDLTNISPRVQTTKPLLAHAGKRGSLFEFSLMVLIVLLFGWFILKPQMAALSASQEDLKAAQSQLDDIRSNKTQLLSLVDTMKKSTTEVASLDEALPIDNRITKIHVMLDGLVKAAGMSLASINIDSGQNKVVAGDQNDVDRPFAQERKLQSVIVTLNATGTMEQGIGLLRSLESNARVVDVDDIGVASDGSGTLSFRTKLKFYYYAPPSAELQK